MNIRLIAVDLDGTLLRNDMKISHMDAQALIKAANLGIYIVICTGRVLRSAEAFSKLLGLAHPIIACNGATGVMARGEKPLWNYHLQPNETRSILEILTREKARFIMYDDNGRVLLASENDSQEMMELMKLEGIRNYEETRFLYDWRTEFNEGLKQIQKFMVLDDNLIHLNAMRDEIVQRASVSISSSWLTNFEIMPLGISKGAGLKQLCNKLGISREEVVAIGDNQNDWEMLLYSGYPIAMGNALPQIKRLAKYITSNNDENGVARAISHILG